MRLAHILTTLLPSPRRKFLSADSSLRRVQGDLATRDILPLLFALLFPATATADPVTFNSGSKQVTLLELYTSQGCSSCPPAERWLNEYVDRDDLWQRVIPVAFHVDYWDYIGWKDRYATEKHGERQRDYARVGNTRTVYTPGLFSNGREWRGWTLRMRPRASSREPGNLSATLTGERLQASFPASAGPLELHVAILGFGIDTKIERGENRNSTLRQEFVVLAHDRYSSENSTWDVSLPDMKAQQAARYGAAIWVAEPGNPTPLQATGGWLPEGVAGTNQGIQDKRSQVTHEK